MCCVYNREIYYLVIQVTCATTGNWRWYEEYNSRRTRRSRKTQTVKHCTARVCVYLQYEYETILKERTSRLSFNSFFFWCVGPPSFRVCFCFVDLSVCCCCWLWLAGNFQGESWCLAVARQKKKHAARFSCWRYKDPASRFRSSVEPQPAAKEEYRRYKPRRKSPNVYYLTTLLHSNSLWIVLYLSTKLNQPKMLRKIVFLLCAASAVLAIPRELSISVNFITSLKSV